MDRQVFHKNHHFWRLTTTFGDSPLKLHHTWWRDTTPVPHHFCHFNCHLIGTPHRTAHHSITKLGRKIRIPLWKSDFSSLLLSTTTTLSSTTCTLSHCRTISFFLLLRPLFRPFSSVKSFGHSTPSIHSQIFL